MSPPSGPVCPGWTVSCPPHFLYPPQALLEGEMTRRPPASSSLPLQAPEGDLRAAEPAEARDRGSVPPPGQASAPKPGALPHCAPCRPPEKDQQEQVEGREVAEPTGAAAQGRGLQHRWALCPPGHMWAWAGQGAGQMKGRNLYLDEGSLTRLSWVRGSRCGL